LIKQQILGLLHKQFKRCVRTTVAASQYYYYYYYYTTVLRPSGLCPGLLVWASTKKVNQEGKSNQDLLEQEAVSGSGITALKRFFYLW